MKVFIMRVKLRASWVHSLKEKRMVVKSIVQKLKNKFNISVIESEKQDMHQTIVIGICGVCGVCGTHAMADSTIENIIDFIEENTDAEIVDIKKETNEY